MDRREEYGRLLLSQEKRREVREVQEGQAGAGELRAQWRQVWIANGYSIDYTGGVNEQGQMVLEGEIDNYPSNNSQKFRGTWTPQENGDVLQRFEAHNAETGNWDMWFEGRYVNKETDPNPPNGD